MPALQLFCVFDLYNLAAHQLNTDVGYGLSWIYEMVRSLSFLVLLTVASRMSKLSIQTRPSSLCALVRLCGSFPTILLSHPITPFYFYYLPQYKRAE
jgi:hypothetical protein